MDPKSHLDSSWRPYVAILALPLWHADFMYFPVSVQAQGSLLAFGRACGPRGSGGGGGWASRGRRIFCRKNAYILHGTLKNTSLFAVFSS